MMLTGIVTTLWVSVAEGCAYAPALAAAAPLTCPGPASQTVGCSWRCWHPEDCCRQPLLVACVQLACRRRELSRRRCVASAALASHTPPSAPLLLRWPRPPRCRLLRLCLLASRPLQLLRRRQPPPPRRQRRPPPSNPAGHPACQQLLQGPPIQAGCGMPPPCPGPGFALRWRGRA